MTVQICVGSSCHIKGAPEIIDLLKNAVTEHHLEQDVSLVGSFCTGKCNRIGVTVVVDGVVHTGINRDCFQTFFYENILRPIQAGRK